jgi:hypothetical protein
LEGERERERHWERVGRDQVWGNRRITLATSVVIAKPDRFSLSSLALPV